MKENTPLRMEYRDTPSPNIICIMTEGTEEQYLLAGSELAEEMRKLRKMQYSGKNSASFVPADEPYKKHKCK